MIESKLYAYPYVLNTVSDVWVNYFAGLKMNWFTYGLVANKNRDRVRAE